MITPGSSFYEAAQAILGALGAPVTPVTVNLLVAWSWCEKPHPDGAWQGNNPLNTTESAGARGVIAGTSIPAYPTQSLGVRATVLTLTNGRYPTLVAALRTQNAGAFLGATGEGATWGTNWTCVREVYAALPAAPPTSSSTSSGQTVRTYDLSANSSAPTPAGRARLWWGMALLVAGAGVIAAVEWEDRRPASGAARDASHHPAQRLRVQQSTTAVGR